MKIALVGDCHGKLPRIPKAADAVLCVGDVCSSRLRKYIFKAMQLQSKGIPVSWIDVAGKQTRSLVHESIRDGERVLRSLSACRKPVFIIPGNWDWTHKGGSIAHKTYREIIRSLKIRDVHMKKRDLGSFCVIGYGDHSGPEIPTSKKGIELAKVYGEYENLRRKYKKARIRLSKLFRDARKPVIFLSHNVPFNTSLDIISYKKSPRYGQHCGSVLARDLIKEFRPVAVVAGHMHGPVQSNRLFGVPVINTGYRKVSLLSL